MFNKNFNTLKKYCKIINDYNSSSAYHVDTSIIGESFLTPSGGEITIVYNHYGLCWDFEMGTIFNKTSGINFVTVSNNTENLGALNGSNVSTLKGWMLNFGSGSTPPTVEDINLVNGYINGTNYRQVELSAVKDVNENKTKVILSIIGTYVAITDMNINEIGMSCGVTNSPNSGYTSIRILFSRNVLENPLEVVAGQGFRISMTIEIPLS